VNVFISDGKNRNPLFLKYFSRANYANVSHVNFIDRVVATFRGKVVGIEKRKK